MISSRRAATGRQHGDRTLDSKRHRVERIIRRTRIAFVLSMAFWLILLVTVVADQLFALGWGSHWSDLPALIGMGLAGCLIYAFCEGIFLFVRLTYRYP